MSRTALALPVLYLLSSLLIAQKPVELKPEDVDVWHHRVGPSNAVHLSASEIAEKRFIRQEYVQFSVVVSANGRPESARPTTGKESPHLDEAEAIIMARSYKPWIVEGVPARVIISDYVSLLPPEKYGPRVPFPDATDLSTVTIGLSRTRCFGSCPAYTLSIDGDGTVHFSGDSVLVPGDHTAHISQEKVRELLYLFRKADFFSAQAVYRGKWTDNPTQTVSLTIGPLSKTVTDYVGTDAGLPLAIRNLEDEIDEEVDTQRWIQTDGSTLASLLAEKWPFTAATEQNLTLFNVVLSASQGPPRAAGPARLLEYFLAVKAPVVSVFERVPSPVCTASFVGGILLVRRMADPVKTFPAKVLTQCLFEAAGGGDAAIFQFWLDRGAALKSTSPVFDSNGYPEATLLSQAIGGGNVDIVRRVLRAGADLSSPQKDTPLLSWAITRSRTQQMPDLIAMLAAAGADVNGRDWMGQTPLISNNFRADLVKPLLAAGANLEARDNNGRTALVAHAFIKEMVVELLSAGADPEAADKKGVTALATARQYGCEACSDLIQEALDKRKAEQGKAQAKDGH